MDLRNPDRRARVLIAKIGLDGHNRGAYVVAYGLREAGMEVIYTGIRQTPSSVARTAIQEGVDVIGISSMVGAHRAIAKKLIHELKRLNASDIPIMLGGIIPEEDYDPLRVLGVAAIFPPGSEVKEMVRFIQDIVKLPGYPPALPGKVISFDIVPLDPASKTGSAGRVPAKKDAWVPEVHGSLTGRDVEELHLTGSRCEGCGQIYFPARRNCPHCLDDRSIKQMPLSDRGTLQTFVIASVAPPGYTVPHAQGYIDLSEGGPRIFSLLTDYGDGSSLKVGCEMGLEIVRLGRDQENRVIVGYRFKPVK